MFYGQSEVLSSLGPHHGNIIFLEASGNLICCCGPKFHVRPTSFDGPNRNTSRP